MESTNKPKSAANECVRRLRRELGLSTRQFAAKVGTSNVAVTRWENDQDTPSDESLAALSVVAAAHGKPEIAYAFTLLLSGSRLGSVFIAFAAAKSQAGIINGLLDLAKFSLESGDVAQAKVDVQRAADMAQQMVKDINHDAHLKPQKPGVEYRAGRSAPVLN